MSDKKQNISCAQRRALPENFQSMVLEFVLNVSGGVLMRYAGCLQPFELQRSQFWNSAEMMLKRKNDRKIFTENGNVTIDVKRRL
jgi:hypothetical protein